MQIMIDIARETPSALRLAAHFLSDHANLIENVPAGTQAPVPPVVLTPGDAPFHTNNVVPFPPAPSVPVADGDTASALAGVAAATLRVPPPPVPTVMTGANSAQGNSTVSVLPVPSTIQPSALHVTTIGAGIAPAPLPPVPSVNASQTSIVPIPPASSAAANTSELDATGMPWDARIHSTKKGHNKDGSWRLRRNLDPAILTAVTQELHARMVNSPVPVGVQASTFPGTSTLPVPPASNIGVPSPSSSGTLPVPPASTDGSLSVFGKSPLPPGVIPASVPLQQPPATSMLVPPPVNVGMPTPPVVPEPLNDFRTFMTRAMTARDQGKITTEQMNGIVQQAGAPSMQLLGSMLHLIPKATFILDATLAGWSPAQINDQLQRAPA